MKFSKAAFKRLAKRVSQLEKLVKCIVENKPIMQIKYTGETIEEGKSGVINFTKAEKNVWDKISKEISKNSQWMEWFQDESHQKHLEAQLKAEKKIRTEPEPAKDYPCTCKRCREVYDKGFADGEKTGMEKFKSHCDENCNHCLHAYEKGLRDWYNTGSNK
jgi:hypothetical protein